jgi:hypothetical protein
MMMTARVLVAVVALAIAACGSDDDSGSDLRLNHMQVVGSHNSYHVQPGDALFDLLFEFAPPLAEAFEYTHLPLGEQFDTQGVRQIELDVFYDPDGGLYESPIGLQLATGNPVATIPGLDLPGFKVLHVQEVDFETTCQTLIECLVDVKDWSDDHPHHVPIMILIEAKDDAIEDPLDLGFLVPPPIGAAEFDILDGEIRSVFPDGQLITPDDVRGGRATLEEAVMVDGWPRVDDSRGRVMFALDNGGAKKADYIAGHESLRGRVMFTSSGPGEAEAGFLKLNDALEDFDFIQEMVAAGLIVRTRADSPEGREARDDDTMRRDVAIASGAQYVSTDYPVPAPDFGTDYQVQIPGGMPVGCNPISAPPECTALLLEDPAELE